MLVVETIAKIRRACFWPNTGSIPVDAPRHDAGLLPKLIDGTTLGQNVESELCVRLSGCAYARFVTVWLSSKLEDPIEIDMVVLFNSFDCFA
jgi:hypothetical protein